jgi:hypothetical protein
MATASQEAGRTRSQEAGWGKREQAGKPDGDGKPESRAATASQEARRRQAGKPSGDGRPGSPKAGRAMRPGDVKSWAAAASREAKWPQS